MTKVLLDIALREHDKRVEEYIELEKLLPAGRELTAMRVAVAALRESGRGFAADAIEAYVERLIAAGAIEAYVERLIAAGKTGW